MNYFIRINQFLLIICVFAVSVYSQTFQKELTLPGNDLIEITNLYGRVTLTAEDTEKAVLTAENASEREIKISSVKNRFQILVSPNDPKSRIDLTLKIPVRRNVRVETGDGQVRISGNFAAAEVKTEKGTIAADVPLDNLDYNFTWTASRPRFLSDVQLDEVKERRAGRFQIKGHISEESPKSKVQSPKTEEETPENIEGTTNSEQEEKKQKNEGQKTIYREQISLNLTTSLGIILLNVNPAEVPSDLRERPLTEAAKAIIRSGDGLLMEAIRRSSPKYFGDYAATLPPLKFEPTLSQRKPAQEAVFSQVKKVLVRVTDMNNRAISDLQKKDFEVFESGKDREILSVEPSTAPFNLVLLLDVSGSVENYVDFIRKAARNFVNTVGTNDKVAILIFNEDVKVLSTFTTNHQKLSESLDSFDAGGGTAFYDSLAFALVDTLRPLRGERTAIVVLSDGDDNKSFLPFDSLLGSIQESGALIYPLYVPSELIAASKTSEVNKNIDPLRTRFMSLTSKAEGEGEKLAQISGGVYYPISQLGELQKAYDDIVIQLRTAYTVTFRSDVIETRGNGTASPRLRVRVNRENSFVKLGSVVSVEGK